MFLKRKGFTLHLLRGNRKANPNHRRKGAGFTIIELLVVIAIITIISGVMIVNFRKGEESNKVRRNVQQVVQGIRKTQNMAISSTEIYNPSSGYKEVPSGGYVFYVRQGSVDDQNNDYYIIFADFNGNKNNDAGEQIERINFEQGIFIYGIRYKPSNGSPSSTNIIFTPPDPSVDLQPAIPPADQVIIALQKVGATCPGTCIDGTSCSSDCRAVKTMTTGWVSIVE